MTLHTAISSGFASTVLPGDVFTIASLYCYESDFSANISRCTFSFNTVGSGCDESNAAGLHCEGKRMKAINSQSILCYA